jgi:hypothetical protein
MGHYSLKKTNPKLAGNLKINLGEAGELYASTFLSDDALNSPNFINILITTKNTLDEIYSYVFGKNLNSLFSYNPDISYAAGVNVFDSAIYPYTHEAFIPLVVKSTLPKYILLKHVTGGVSTLFNLIDLSKSNLGTWLNNTTLNYSLYPKNVFEINTSYGELCYIHGIDVTNNTYTKTAKPFSIDLFNVNGFVEVNKYFFDAFSSSKLIYPHIINISYCFNNPNNYTGITAQYVDELKEVDSVYLFDFNRLFDSPTLDDNNKFTTNPFFYMYREFPDYVEIDGTAYKIDEVNGEYIADSTKQLNTIQNYKLKYNQKIIKIIDNILYNKNDTPYIIPSYDPNSDYLITIGDNVYTMKLSVTLFTIITEDIISYDKYTLTIKKTSSEKTLAYAPTLDTAPLRITISKVITTEVKSLDDNIDNNPLCYYDGYNNPKSNPYETVVEDPATNQITKSMYIGSGEYVDAVKYSNRNELYNIVYNGSYSNGGIGYPLNVNPVVEDYNRTTNLFHNGLNPLERSLGHFCTYNKVGEDGWYYLKDKFSVDSFNYDSLIGHQSTVLKNTDGTYNTLFLGVKYNFKSPIDLSDYKFTYVVTQDTSNWFNIKNYKDGSVYLNSATEKHYVNYKDVLYEPLVDSPDSLNPVTISSGSPNWSYSIKKTILLNPTVAYIKNDYIYNNGSYYIFINASSLITFWYVKSYNKGDKVIYQNMVWESAIDNNIDAPNKTNWISSKLTGNESWVVVELFSKSNNYKEGVIIQCEDMLIQAVVGSPKTSNLNDISQWTILYNLEPNSKTSYDVDSLIKIGNSYLISLDSNTRYSVTDTLYVNTDTKCVVLVTNDETGVYVGIEENRLDMYVNVNHNLQAVYMSRRLLGLDTKIITNSVITQGNILVEQENPKTVAVNGKILHRYNGSYDVNYI